MDRSLGAGQLDLPELFSPTRTTSWETGIGSVSRIDLKFCTRNSRRIKLTPLYGQPHLLSTQQTVFQLLTGGAL